MTTIFFDMDATLTEWREIAGEEELYRKNYFLSLQPNRSVIESAKRLTQTGAEVYILSCVLTDSLYALEEKKTWLRKYMPFVPEEHWIFVPYGESKPQFLRTRLGLPGLSANEVLVDDYSVNLRDWTDHNGLAVKLMNGKNGTKGTWQGLSVGAESADRILPALLSGTAA